MEIEVELLAFVLNTPVSLKEFIVIHLDRKWLLLDRIGQQYCFMPVKACDKLSSYNSCKGNGTEECPIRCSNCGEKLIDGAKFCDICGHTCASPEQQEYIRKRREGK